MEHTILFADNERGIRRFCKQELEAAGYNVLLADDGVEALDLVDTFAVDLVVLDEHMPRCGGLEAARHIKRWYPHLPVVLFTGDPDYEQYRSPLVDAATIKSADPSALKEAIVKFLPSGRVTAPERYASRQYGFQERSRKANMHDGFKAESMG